MEFGAKELRAIRILDKHLAHELRERPLRVLDDLVRIGIAERKEYTQYCHGRVWDCYATGLTEKGRQVAAALSKPEPL